MDGKLAHFINYQKYVSAIALLLPRARAFPALSTSTRPGYKVKDRISAEGRIEKRRTLPVGVESDGRPEESPFARLLLRPIITHS